MFYLAAYKPIWRHYRSDFQVSGWKAPETGDSRIKQGTFERNHRVIGWTEGEIVRYLVAKPKSRTNNDNTIANARTGVGLSECAQIGS